MVNSTPLRIVLTSVVLLFTAILLPQLVGQNRQPLNPNSLHYDTSRPTIYNYLPNLSSQLIKSLVRPFLATTSSLSRSTSTLTSTSSGTSSTRGLSFFAGLTGGLAGSTMAPKRKQPPAPTVPTAVKAKEEVERATQEGKVQEGVETAIFASGCFWGTEHLFTTHYSHLPQFSAVSGYTGGKESATDPTYRQVCSGTTDHAEAVKVTYGKGSVAYAELVEFFYRTHDPTTVNRQGPDVGTQYRSALFYTDEQQKEIADKVTEEVEEMHLNGKKVATTILPAGKWWDAEEYHQLYLDRNPGGYECPTHRFYW